MTAMTAAAVPYALAGYEVILDFSIPPWFLDAVRKVVKIKDAATKGVSTKGVSQQILTSLRGGENSRDGSATTD